MIGLSGANGFIGQSLQKSLKGYEFEPFKTDLVNHTTRTTSLNGEFFGCKKYVHLAGKNRGSNQEIIDVNVNGTLNVIHYCRQYNIPLIVAGADYHKDDAYRLSKSLMRDLCKANAYLELDSLYLNIPKVIGKGCRPFYNSFTTTLIYYAAKNQLKENLHLIKNMNETLSLIHIDTLCDVIKKYVDKDFYGYNEYSFDRWNGLLSLTFKELVAILEGDKNHKYSQIFLDLMEHYKTYEIS